MPNLLVALDTSEGSHRVLEEATKLSRSLGAELEFFHVMEPMATYIPVGSSMDILTTTPVIPDDDFLAAGKARLEHLAVMTRSRGITVRCHCTIGLPAEEIVEKARALGCDYIVLGSHGHGAIFHLLSGSVVTCVLKQSPCPVVVVPIRS